MKQTHIQKRPTHPAVDWNTSRRIKNRECVKVTCPWCEKSRFDDAPTVAYRIRKGTYTGYCYKDRLLQTQRQDRLERPDHPQVDWADVAVVSQANGQRLTRVGVTCPDCGQKRYAHPGQVAAKLRANRFRGRCEQCRRTTSPKYEPKPYIKIALRTCPPEDLHLFKAMRGKRSYVLEHRLVMAHAIGRPLRQDELVDHMDGNHKNNDIANLRIYLRGRNQPGSACGYGTYYHEWQMAIAEVDRVKALIAE